MKIKKDRLGLAIAILIFLIVFSIRLYISFSAYGFKDDTSYFHARYIENLKQDLRPKFYDELSYSGRPIIPNFFFHYCLLAFSWIPGYLKIVPQLFISLSVIISYLFARKFLKEFSAIFSSFVVGFLPLLFKETINSINVFSLFLPLTVLLFYFFTLKKFKLFFITSIALSLLHPYALFIAVVFVFYLLLSYAEDVLQRWELKYAILFLVTASLVNLLIYFKPISYYGMGVLYGNIPKSMLVQSYKQLGVLSLIYNIGYVPLIFGGVAMYYGISRRVKFAYLLGSLALIAVTFVYLHIINFFFGLIFLSLALALLSGYFVEKLYNYLTLTKISKFKNFIIGILILAVVATSVYASLDIGISVNKYSRTAEELNSLLEVKNTSRNAVVISDIFDGNFISYAGLRNVVDLNFLLAPDPLERLLDIDAFFTTANEDRALEIAHKYNVSYVFVSDRTEALYGEPKFEEMSCFKRKNIYVYKVIC